MTFYAFKTHIKQVFNLRQTCLCVLPFRHFAFTKFSLGGHFGIVSLVVSNII